MISGDKDENSDNDNVSYADGDLDEIDCNVVPRVDRSVLIRANRHYMIVNKILKY